MGVDAGRLARGGAPRGAPGAVGVGEDRAWELLAVAGVEGLLAEVSRDHLVDRAVEGGVYLLGITLHADGGVARGLAGLLDRVVLLELLPALSPYVVDAARVELLRVDLVEPPPIFGIDEQLDDVPGLFAPLALDDGAGLAAREPDLVGGLEARIVGAGHGDLLAVPAQHGDLPAVDLGFTDVLLVAHLRHATPVFGPPDLADVTRHPVVAGFGPGKRLKPARAAGALLAEALMTLKETRSTDTKPANVRPRKDDGKPKTVPSS